jgi:hypothetical protein
MRDPLRKMIASSLPRGAHCKFGPHLRLAFPRTLRRLVKRIALERLLAACANALSGVAERTTNEITRIHAKPRRRRHSDCDRRTPISVLV